MRSGASQAISCLISYVPKQLVNHLTLEILARQAIADDQATFMALIVVPKCLFFVGAAGTLFLRFSRAGRADSLAVGHRRHTEVVRA